MHFRIKPGHTFRDSDDKVKGAGETIELDEDGARLHADKVEPLDQVDVQSSAPFDGTDS